MNDNPIITKLDIIHSDVIKSHNELLKHEKWEEDLLSSMVKTTNRMEERIRALETDRTFVYVGIFISLTMATLGIIL